MKILLTDYRISKMRSTEIIKNNRGMALLITIMIITLLIAATLELNRRARSAIISTAATRDRFTLSYMASSGINAAMAMLVKDKADSSSDSLQEDWANPEKISELLLDTPFEDGSVTLKISDEISRIQINALVEFPETLSFNENQRTVWDNLLRFLISQDEFFEDIEPSTIINSAKDWLDSGDDDLITGLSGAESDYYEDLDPPYSCRNGLFSYIDELALVRGITPELFYGTGDTHGILRYTTIYGMNVDGALSYEGRININTAELPVIVAILPSDNEDFAQKIYDFRQETSDSNYIHNLSGSKWYKDVPGCGDTIIEPELITTSSDLFRIESDATLHEMKFNITTIVQREKDNKSGKWKCKVLSWEAGIN